MFIKTYTLPIVIAALITTSNSLAKHQTTIEQAHQRITDARKKIATQAAHKNTTDALLTRLSNTTLSGLGEIEAFASDNYTGDSDSDLIIATLALSIESHINPSTTATISFLYEEDDTDFGIDEAYLQFENFAGSSTLLLGRNYVPFGAFDTHLINDTLILELAETLETTAMLSAGYKALSASVYIFDGNSDDNNTLEDFGISLSFSPSERLTLGIHFINDLGESDNLDIPGSQEINAYIINAAINIAGVTFLIESLTADSFETELGLFNPSNTDLGALQLEAATSFNINGAEITTAIAYQESKEALALELPKERISLGISFNPMPNTTLSIEYTHDTDYGVNDRFSGSGPTITGTGATADALILQISAEF